MPFLYINKLIGWTSFDAVNYIRKIARDATHDKKIKVGHAGTLDPFATGLLIIGVGKEATKRLEEFKNLPKTYVAGIRLGAVSDTQDSTGTITDTMQAQRLPTKENIVPVLQLFKGRQDQIPPMFSAKKINGKRLYKLARKGVEVEREPVSIEIYDIKLLDYNWPTLIVEVNCSAGTYIRSLAHDIGAKLGTGGYCAELTRTKIGPYTLEKAEDVKHINFNSEIQEN